MNQPFMDWPFVESHIQAWRDWRDMQEERLMISMTSFLPPVSGEAGAVNALLQVIADPKAAKAVLDKMEEKRKEIENAIEKQQKMNADHAAEMRKAADHNEKLKADGERTASKAQADLGAAKNTLAQAERSKAQAEHAVRQTAEIRAELEEREEKMEARAKELAAEMRDMQKRESACKTEEEKLAKREADLAAREKKLDADIAENEKWLAGLKPPRGR